MGKGGARSRSGPPPTSAGRSHKAKADVQGFTVLPADGRDEPAPDFPLIDPNARELELWAHLWTLPQAVAWEDSRLEFEVASYVRVLARAELPESSAMLWAQTKQMGESLGLSASGMARNRWSIGTPPDDSEEGSAPVAGVASIADRLRVARSG